MDLGDDAFWAATIALADRVERERASSSQHSHSNSNSNNGTAPQTAGRGIKRSRTDAADALVPEMWQPAKYKKYFSPRSDKVWCAVTAPNKMFVDGKHATRIRWSMEPLSRIYSPSSSSVHLRIGKEVVVVGQHEEEEGEEDAKDAEPESERQAATDRAYARRLQDEMDAISDSELETKRQKPKRKKRKVDSKTIALTDTITLTNNADIKGVVETDIADDTCTICISNRRNVVNLECGHNILCLDCAMVKPFVLTACPLCRTPLHTLNVIVV
jgi:hypothetical protein